MALFKKQIETDHKIIDVVVHDFFEDYDEDLCEDFAYFNFSVLAETKNDYYKFGSDKIKYIARNKISDGEVIVFTQSISDVYEHLLFSNIEDEEFKQIIDVINECYEYVYEK